MRLPNKNTPIQKSILPLLPIILNNIPSDGISLNELYKSINNYFESVLDFRDSITCLIVIGKINLSNNLIKKGVL